MTLKFFEIRDRGTTIPAMAIEIVGSNPVTRRAGFGASPCYLLTNLGKVRSEYDPWAWGQTQGRTMHVAHVWLQNGGWAELPTLGGVIDVEFILGERDTPKTAECV